MAQFIPVTLSGDTLGQRHRYLNSLVNQAANELSSFDDSQATLEQTPVDRLFKIDLAIKLHNVDYILRNLRDEDMLYVSRALKCKWLLERRDIINPKYLEDVLFPEMVMPAISKMKHWLYINLRDPSMCQEFYQYYKDTKFEFAVKFLRHCSNNFVLDELPKILTKITPHNLKVLGEKCPGFVKIYFNSLATDKELAKRYLTEENKFYKNTKCILKADPDIFLDITERYHTLNNSNRLSPAATDYIIRYHKSRFMAKPELYVVYLLHMRTVATCLSVAECEHVVLKLARADFISSWFSYKAVEPLVKRISPEKRAAFKKRVFVEKNVGEQVIDWPYPLPVSLTVDTLQENCFVFHDREFKPIKLYGMGLDYRCMLKKRKYAKWSEPAAVRDTQLQKLFNEFRFMGFEHTLHELKTRVGVTSSADRRCDMLLVLVSKSGGRVDAVRALLQLAMRLRNEPVHQRATVIRSLVKRASVWRLPQDVWDTMLEYARGLGLDGSEPEADCREGLHAVVMRQLIATRDCQPAVRTAFLKDFSTFVEYKPVGCERTKLVTGLQHILVTISSEAKPEEAAYHLNLLLDVLTKYHINFESTLSAITALAKRDAKAANSLLKRLYAARIGRRELLRQNLDIRRDDAALLNALRHDPDAIAPEWVVQLLADSKTRANHFFLKLAIYFKETGGLAEIMQRSLQENIKQNPDVIFARPLATLAGSDISSLWREQDEAGAEHHKLAAALRAYMHRARPAPDAVTLGWRQAGMKAVACCATRCRPALVPKLVQTFLDERVKRTVRLALMLAQNIDSAADWFSLAVTIRPLATLRAALLYYRKFGDKADSRICDIVKSTISTVGLKPGKGFRRILDKVEWIPSMNKPDYCALMYLVRRNISDGRADFFVCELMNYLSKVSDKLLENVMLQVLEDLDRRKAVSFPAIIIRFLMLSKTNDEANIRFEKIGSPLLAKIDTLRARRDSTEETDIKYFFSDSLEQMLSSLLYNFAFFDIQYQNCLLVIEKILIWVQNFMPKDMFFKDYVKIHAIMLYYKAVRQSLQQSPEVFEDPAMTISAGVDTVGFIFGGYVAKDASELRTKYFDSIIEIYSEAFVEFLSEYTMSDEQKQRFIAAIVKGMLSECVGGEARLAIYTVRCMFGHEENEEIQDLIMRNPAQEAQFLLHALA